MFLIKEIDYAELSDIKKEYNLEITISLFNDISGIHKILYNDTPIGVIIFRLDEYFNGVLIDYFEIFKDKRNNKFGRRFISSFTKEIEKDLEKDYLIYVYITPLPEKIKFWTKCGFKTTDRIRPMYRYKCVSNKK